MSTARHTDDSLEAIVAGSAPQAPGADPARLLLTPIGTRQRQRGGDRDLARAFERGDGALLERLRTLRSILPAMATEVAIARREGARLRLENAKLRDLLTVAQGSLPAGLGAPAGAGRGDAR